MLLIAYVRPSLLPQLSSSLLCTRSLICFIVQLFSIQLLCTSRNREFHCCRHKANKQQFNRTNSLSSFQLYYTLSPSHLHANDVQAGTGAAAAEAHKASSTQVSPLVSFYTRQSSAWLLRTNAVARTRHRPSRRHPTDNYGCIAEAYSQPTASKHLPRWKWFNQLDYFYYPKNRWIICTIYELQVREQNVTNTRIMRLSRLTQSSADAFWRERFSLM